jgi:7-keto-8-aminopelargonate synthetase-like enzyme
MPEHVELEERMARFKGAEAALLFNSAYLANLGLITSLADASTTVYSDELNHASLIDAIRLSRAKVVIYPHRDAAALRRMMTPGRNLIVTESLFSMDGDMAPLDELASLEAVLIVDDTHATGLLGEKGRGTTAEVQVCNLAKAGGFMGGFVVGSRKLIDLLTTTARTMVYTTSLPAGVCRAAVEAIDALEAADGARAKLRRNIELFSPKAASPIIPIVMGTTERALRASERLWEQGFFVPAIRPPTVPEGTARLRVSLTAMHEPEHIESLAKALCQI